MDSSDIISRINTGNAKLLALIIVSGVIVYHGILHLSSGIDSCKWLLSDGRFQGNTVWQPYGCMMHTYSHGDSQRCIHYIAYWGGHTHIVFIGDSRVRQLFDAFVKQITTRHKSDKDKHQDKSFTNNELKITVDFFWRPMVDDAMMDVYESYTTTKQTKPSLIVTGSASWAIKTSNASLEMFESYKQNLTKLVPLTKLLNPNTKILWVLQDPVIEENLHPSRIMITNEQIDLYNKAAMDTLRYSRIHVWKSSRLVSQGLNQEKSDGLHISETALNFAVQILFNLYCNDHMNYNDGTCCSSSEPVTSLQIITFSILAVSGCLAVAMYIQQKCVLSIHSIMTSSVSTPTDSALQQPEYSYYELCTALGRFGLIMAYFFLCDRTHFFMKENKYYTNTNFGLPVIYFFVLGLFLTEDSQFTQILHRDQTNEWKGWMQLVILIYHLTGASQVLPIYMHVRVLVAAYLFLSGYGHFSHFYQTGDCGFYRFWRVVFRLNLLVVVLCLCMNRPYQFYYFVPLVTFWFLFMYITMAALPRVTSASAETNPIQYLYLVLKFVAFFSVVTILYMSEVFFEKIFLTRPWKALFVTTDDSIKEWWFRWRVDRYSVGFGMLFAFACQLLKQYNILDDKTPENLFSRGFSITAAFVSIIGLLSYTGFSLLCGNKLQCNEVHPYVSFIPIISYVTLRNVSGFLRTKFSIFFAWFGKISLELFIAQYHIWLSANTYGVLVFIPGYPVLNVMVTSYVFVCIAHEINRLTGVLVKYAIPSDWRYLVRNVTIFFLILVPIGIHDGMF